MRLIIFGTGIFYSNRKEMFSNDLIVRYADNDASKWNKKIDNIEIINPSRICEFEYDYICIMGNPKNTIEIRKQLFRMDVPIENVIDYNEFLALKGKYINEEKRIVVFGTGKYFLNRKHIFQDVHVFYYLDNNSDKWNTEFEEGIIINPNALKKIRFDYVSVMVSDKFKEQIVNQLIGMGIPKEKILDYNATREKLNIHITDEEKKTMEFFKTTEEPGRCLKREFIGKVQVKPLVTIITPYYNAGEYFEQTFNCVINQTFPWYEWIIVNDGSTNEDDIKRLNEFAVKDARIRVVNQDNMRAAAARNRGFKEAKTDIVVQLDADDLISEQYLEYIFWALYYNKDAAWAYTANVGFQAQNYLWKKPWNAEKMKTENFLTAFAGIRKSAWELVGGYRVENFQYNEDWYFWLKMLSKHQKPVSIPSYMTWYRRHDKGMLTDLANDSARQIRDREMIKEIATTADGTVKAKEFPVMQSEHFYEKIEKIDWSDEYVIPKNKETNILIVIPWIVVGGADKFIVDVVEGLTKRGYDVSIFTTLSSNNEWQYKLAKYTDNIYNLPDFLEAPHYLAYTEYYIKSRQIDVVMVTNSAIAYYMTPYLRCQFPELVIFDYVHMEEWYWRAGGHARTSGILGDVCERTYVCNSATRRVMIEHFNRNEESVKTLYIGVDADYFDEKKVGQGYLYNICKIEKERPIVLFPCRLHQQKRPYLMLEIAEEVVKRKPEVFFAIVGDGPERAEIEKRINDRDLADNVKCIGSSERMRECYKDAKCTLICSIKEGLTLTAYESLAMKTPVISSDVGGQGDLIDESVGALIPMLQSEADSLEKREDFGDEKDKYVEAIINILSDEKRYIQLTQNCRARIESQFSIKLMVEKLDKEIKEMLYDEALRIDRMQKAETLSRVKGIAEELYTLGAILN